MPGRKIPLVTGHIYHIVNHGVASQDIFLTDQNYKRAIETALYYQNQSIPLRYSNFIKQTQNKRIEILDSLRQQHDFLVEIIVYCLMPNHIHLLLKQTQDNGISTFMSKFANSYTRYFNIKNKRTGHLFQGKFKSVLIETDDQLLHVSRYIHLNPFSSNIIKTIKKLKEYSYSSYHEYINAKIKNFCNQDLILNHFKGRDSYQNFVCDHANHQKSLEIIKHLII